MDGGALDLGTWIEVDDIGSENATTLVLAIDYDGIQAALHVAGRIARLASRVSRWAMRPRVRHAGHSPEQLGPGASPLKPAQVIAPTMALLDVSEHQLAIDSAVEGWHGIARVVWRDVNLEFEPALESHTGGLLARLLFLVPDREIACQVLRDGLHTDPFFVRRFEVESLNLIV